MFMRLVITRRDGKSTRKLGVFQAAYELLDAAELTEAEHGQLADVICWFERYLPLPWAGSLEPRTIFWFRSESLWLVRRIWDLAAILGENGYHVELLKTARPGYVRYADAYQVAATPFRDSRIG